MDIFFILLIFVGYGISYYYKKKIVPRIKGTIGEFNVSTKLNYLNKKDYIVLNDILIYNGNYTTQIDHIVISKFGIFVIETKNYKGWIHGHEKAEYWTQTIYKYKKKIRNPIKQNWAHVYAVKKVLSDYKYIDYYPIVVFTGNGVLKNVTTSLPVIYSNQLIRTIKNVNGLEILSYIQMKSILGKLYHQNIIVRKENRNHSKQVKDQITERKRKETLKICPKCGNNLIVKNGRFFGCENFPECRYTVKLN